MDLIDLYTLPHATRIFLTETTVEPMMSGNTCGVVTVRSRICYLLSILKIHPRNCEHCAALLACGIAIRERLAALNGRDERTSNSGNEGRAPVLRKAG
jgi:hypothetical protein